MDTKVTSKSNSHSLKIYIDGFIHLRIPRGNGEMSIHSWIDDDSKVTIPNYYIEIHNMGQTIKTTYYKKELWESVLTELDNNI